MWAAVTNPDDWWGFHLDGYTKPPENGFKTKDGGVSFTVGRLPDENWEALLRDLAFDPNNPTDREQMDAIKTAGNPSTSRRGEHVRPYWRAALAKFTTQEVMDILERHGGDATPLNNFENVLKHPQTQYMQVIEEMNVDGKPLQFVRAPWRLQETPVVSAASPPPALGQHTEEVLRELAAASPAAR
jgi:crotonobetainyl-CoA:carnitine CoA-transferase CaiB-like acyl-CoA transferase